MKNHYQEARETLQGIFSRFTPHLPSSVSKECSLKLGIKLNQLQNIALRTMLLDYCLFHHPIQGKTLIAEFMDQNVSQLTENRSEEHTSELQSLMRISYAVFCLKKKKIIYR